MRKIKVAQVIGPAAEGGVESCIMNYYCNIDREKVSFSFLVERTSKIIDREKIESLGGEVIIIPSYKKPRKYIKELTKIFRDNHFDIVHSNMNALSVFTLKAAKNAGVKIRIAHSHSTSNSKEIVRNIAKNVLRKFSTKYATHYLACSEKAGRWLFGDKLFDEGKVLVINNAVFIDKFKFDSDLRNKMREAFNIQNQFVVGHVGRFMKQKNHSFLIDVFYEIQKRRPESVLALLGDGPEYEKIKEKVVEYGIEDKVLFLGVHKHAFRYYQMMDCFVLPSLYEGLPVVGIEAQMNGLDCYFSDQITEEVKINKNVEFLPLKSSNQHWAEIILQKSSVCDSLEKKRERLEFIQNFIGSKYDIENEAKNLLSFYYQIMTDVNH